MNQKELIRQDVKFITVAKTKIALMLGRSVRKTINFIGTFGGGSYTDGKTVAVGTPEFVIEGTPAYDKASKLTGLKFTYIEVWMMRTALLIHEVSHLLFSSFKEFKKFQDWCVVEFDSMKPKLTPEGQKVLPQVVRRIAAQLDNAVEDGRCEHFLVNKFPGSAKYLKFLNGTFWKMSVQPADSDIVNLIMSLCYIATSGVTPQYYGTLDKELRDNVEMVWKDVLDVTNTASPMVANKKLQKVMIKLKPYIEKKLIIEVENAALLQQLIEMLIEFSDFTNGNPSEKPSEDLDGNSITVHISMPGKPGKGKGKGKGSPSEEKSEEKSEDGEGSDGKEEDKDEDKKDGKGKDGKEEDKAEAKKDGEGEEGKDKKEDKKGKVDKSKSKPAKKRQAPDHAERGGDETSEDSGDEQNSENNGQGDGGENVAADSENEDLTAINEAIKEEIDRAIEESTQAATKEYAAQVKKAENSEKEDENLADSDISDIREGYDDPHVEGFKSVNVDSSTPAPEEIRKRGRMLRKQLEQFFKEQETYDLREQHSGRLDKKALHKIGANDYRIFEKKGQPYAVDTCLTIVWDGSGSMCGEKQKQSTIACATIEEALKSLMPMKIINFTTESNMVKHYNVKGFEDVNNNKNYAYSYGSSRSFSGGNKDGYSIKVATKELQKRSEANKIMIIMSDGLPSDYRGHGEALGDVKTAVKNARKDGIKVIAMFFGDTSFRRNTYAEYKAMYEKNLINCAPENITKELVKEIRNLFMSR